MAKKKYAVCIALFVFLFVSCTTVQRPKPLIVEVKCSECDGNGKVTYGPDHPIVKIGFDPGTYDCPMCGGSGRLAEESAERTTYDGNGKRPSTMPPKRSDGREFDGGPDFGNGIWAKLDEDGVWRRYGG
jgi:RecJ-like exonuclease